MTEQPPTQTETEKAVSALLKKIEKPTVFYLINNTAKVPLIQFKEKPLIGHNATDLKNLSESDQRKQYQQLNDLKEDLECSVNLMEKSISEKDRDIFYSGLDTYRMLFSGYLNLYKQLYNADENIARKSIDGICKRKESAYINAYLKGIA
jgi:hypothetical protein